ncbi:alpha/beta-Hydrolases superfamily protein [Rhynchospora pubera]|uniref:Alpha/beta-Hydrolases superfamily protein n=1 Tax=Rhynchospora pubera TaxID=906938 RepID=A0AAV8FDK0_9POAL|nr:alpha/beta-Hydrolases superfamily protein [Rhynchospora pubera]
MMISSTNSPPMLTSGASGRLSALLSLFALRQILLFLQSLLLILLLPFRRSVVSTNGGAGLKKGSSGIVVKVPPQLAPAAHAVVARRQREHEVAARRQLAIRRVETARREEEEKNGKRILREYDLIATERGETLFVQSWIPVGVKAKGVVVIMHGLNEHSGRYDHLARKLNENGFKVYAMDWTGHGGSDGLHGYVQSLDHAVSDLKKFLNKLSVGSPDLPCFLFGHSTGGAIILKAVLDPKIQNQVDGIVMTSPAVKVQPAHPLVATLAPIFSLIAPRYQFSSAQKAGRPVSRDPEALRSKYSDPLVFTEPIRVRTGYEILRITSYLQHRLGEINVPFLVLHGTSDSVTDPNGSKRLHEEARSEDKCIRLYDGLLHDLLIEPEKDLILQDIVDWFKSRV